MPDYYLIEDAIRRFFIDEERNSWELPSNLWFW
jgi:hypothetical protein